MRRMISILQEMNKMDPYGGWPIYGDYFKELEWHIQKIIHLPILRKECPDDFPKFYIEFKDRVLTVKFFKKKCDLYYKVNIKKMSGTKKMKTRG